MAGQWSEIEHRDFRASDKEIVIHRRQATVANR